MDNSAAALPPLPTYDCRQIPRPLELDGALGDPLWATAPPIHLVERVTGARTAQETTGRLLWHGDYLYLGAEMEEFDVEDHNEKHNDHVFGEQCVELFLAAPAGVPSEEGQAWRYLEIDTSPTGIFWDARVTNPRGIPDPSVRKPLTLDESYWPYYLLSTASMQGTLIDPSDRDLGGKLVVQFPFTGPP